MGEVVSTIPSKHAFTPLPCRSHDVTLRCCSLPCVWNELAPPNRAAFGPYLAAIGFNVETVTYKNIKFQVWDLGARPPCEHGTLHQWQERLQRLSPHSCRRHDCCLQGGRRASGRTGGAITPTHRCNEFCLTVALV